MKLIDARGLSCPEPVIMLRKAMTTREAAYTMIVDNVTSREDEKYYDSMYKGR